MQTNELDQFPLNEVKVDCYIMISDWTRKELFTSFSEKPPEILTPLPLKPIKLHLYQLNKMLNKDNNIFSISSPKEKKRNKQ